MCLRRVDGKTKYTKRRIGYKVFNLEGEHLVGLYHGREDSYTLGIENIASEDGSSRGYPLGFHILPTKADAVKWNGVHEGDGVWEVRLSDVVASGNDDCLLLPVIVARRMTIIRKVAWPKRYT